MSPDATAFAHLVDDGGYPRAVQRFLPDRRVWGHLPPAGDSSRDVELPVEGPVNRVMHSADGHWLACEVAPEGGSRSQIWVVTTDPDDRDARRIDNWPAGGPDGTAELIGWDGTRVAAILTGDDGVGSSCLIDPADGATVVLDDGRVADWSTRGPERHSCGSGHAGTATSSCCADSPKSRCCPTIPAPPRTVGSSSTTTDPGAFAQVWKGELYELYQPASAYGVNSTEGYVRALIRSENGTEHARLLEVTSTPDGVSYQVVAERPGYELDEFTVSDDLSTVAILWNINGTSELQILELADYMVYDPIPLPGWWPAS